MEEEKNNTEIQSSCVPDGFVEKDCIALENCNKQDDLSAMETAVTSIKTDEQQKTVPDTNKISTGYPEENKSLESTLTHTVDGPSLEKAVSEGTKTFSAPSDQKTETLKEPTYSEGTNLKQSESYLNKPNTSEKQFDDCIESSHTKNKCLDMQDHSPSNKLHSHFSGKDPSSNDNEQGGSNMKSKPEKLNPKSKEENDGGESRQEYTPKSPEAGNKNVSSSCDDKTRSEIENTVESKNPDCHASSFSTENGQSEELPVDSERTATNTKLSSYDEAKQENNENSIAKSDSKKSMEKITEKTPVSKEEQIFADFSSQSDSDTDGDRLWIAEAMDTDDGGDNENTENCKDKSRSGMTQDNNIEQEMNGDIVKENSSNSSHLASLPKETILLEGTASVHEDKNKTVSNNLLNDHDVPLSNDPDSTLNDPCVSDDTNMSSSKQNQRKTAVKSCTGNSDLISSTISDSAVAVDFKSLSDSNRSETVAAGSSRTSTSVEKTSDSVTTLPKQNLVTVPESSIQSGSHVSAQSQSTTLVDKHPNSSSDSAIPALQDLINNVNQTIKKEPEDYIEFSSAVPIEHMTDSNSQSSINSSSKSQPLSSQMLVPPRPISLLQNVAHSQTLPSIRPNVGKQNTKSQPLAYLVPVSSVRTQPMKAVTKVSFTNREKLPSTKVSHTIASVPRPQATKIIGKFSQSTSSAINIQSVGLQKITELIARKNHIPNYKPPPAPVKLFQSQPSECYHVCYECGDTFYLEKSLIYHRNRMSMKIKYKCEMCHTEVFFYNKCMFLSHLRTHLKIDKSQAVPIHIKSDSISISLVKENVFFAMDQTESVNEHPADREKGIMLKTPSNDQSSYPQKDTVCHMCGALFTSYASLAIHYGQAETKCKSSVFCGVCQMHLPSACSLKAHRNLHKDSVMLVCPECGISMLPEQSQKFYHHLIDSCYHFFRFTDFSCPKCHVVLESGAGLNDHLMLNVNQYFKCKSCPMAFKTLESFKNHFRDSHSGEMEGTVTRVVFRCHICDSVMDNKTVLELHVNVHIADAKKVVTFKYRCRYCLQVFKTKNNLALHIGAEHTYSNSLKCTPCAKLFQNKKDLAFHFLNHHNSVKVQTTRIQSCKKCGFLYLDKDYNSGHRTSQDCCNSVYRCKVCGVNCKIGKSLVAHLKMHQEQGVLICHICNSENFKSKEEYNKHLVLCTQTNEGSKKVLDESENQCDHCYKNFSNKEELQYHINSEHKLPGLYPCHLCGLTYETNQSLRRHIKIVHEGKRHVYPCYMCRKKNLKKCFSKRILLERHLTSRHHLTRTQWDESQITREYPGSEELQTAPDKATSKRKNHLKDSDNPVKRLRVEGENKFICAKCEFSCGEREKFLNHIDGHRMKNSVQCPECGLCFAVLPSLHKHLFIVHKIKEFEQYCEDNADAVHEKEEIVDIEADSGENDVMDTERDPLQCHICYILFETEAACKTHMRTHGMAFLQAKRKDAKLAKSKTTTSPVKSSSPNIDIKTE